MIRSVLVYRRVPLLVLGTVLLSVVGFVSASSVLEVDFNPNDDSVGLRFSEACGVGSAILAVTLLRPRFWEWERAATHRATVGAVVSAGMVVVIALTSATISVLNLDVHPSLGHEGVYWHTVLEFTLLNTGIIATLVLILTPFLGPLVSGVLGLLVWYSTAVLNNLLPASREYTPTIAYRVPFPDTWPGYRWYLLAVLLVVALVVHTRTRGSTEFAQRMFHRG